MSLQPSFWVVLFMGMKGARPRLRRQDSSAETCVSVFADRRELVARMEVALRRQTTSKPTGPLVVGALRICTSKRVATWQGQALTLSPKEFDILATLAAHCGQVVSRTFLFESLWGNDFRGEERLIDRHIMKLRQKLECGTSMIETVWGAGYRLVAPVNKPSRKSKVQSLR